MFGFSFLSLLAAGLGTVLVGSIVLVLFLAIKQQAVPPKAPSSKPASCLFTGCLLLVLIHLVAGIVGACWLALYPSQF